MAKATKKPAQKHTVDPKWKEKAEKNPTLRPVEKEQVFALYHGTEVFRHVVQPDNEPNVNCGNPSMYRLILAPLDAISDEHIMEVLQLNMPERNLAYLSARERDTLLRDFREQMKEQSHKLGYRSWNLLARRGYAVPLFFDLNHWANGKTALELGLAVPPPAPVEKAPAKGARGPKKAIPAKKATSKKSNSKQKA